MTPGDHRPISVGSGVAAALAEGRPVVALESTIISHGLPWPRNLEVAHELESIVREGGAVPATVGVIGGRPVVGLDGQDLEILAGENYGTPVRKASVRDLPVVSALQGHAGTTVASTAFLAHSAGIRCFATGGIGGVHRGASETFDESADLAALASTPIVVVCAGVKSILDIGATLERLESLGVTVVGWRTGRFPGFYVTDSGLTVDWRLETAQQVADVAAARDRLGLRSAVVVASPVPPEHQLDPALHDSLVSEALEEAARRGLTGKAVTPFLLDHLYRASGGASLEANVRAVRNNAVVAAAIARAMSKPAP